MNLYGHTIIYIHKNDCSYLNDVFNITSKNNNCRIILIGDEYNKKYSDKYNIEFYSIKDYTEEFNYTHISVNIYDYEKICFERWIILANFIKKHNITDKIIYCDSDNVLLKNITDVDIINNYDILYLGNDEVCVPNLLICNPDVFQIIKQYIYLFYNRSYDEIYKSIKKINHHENGILHYSDMWLVKDVFNNISKNTCIFDISYNNTKYTIINLENTENTENTENIFISNYDQIKNKNIDNIVNIHFNGNNKMYIKNYI